MRRFLHRFSDVHDDARRAPHGLRVALIFLSPFRLTFLLKGVESLFPLKERQEKESKLLLDLSF